jgi:hypothetical protein
VLFSLDTHDRVMREYAGRAGIVVIGIDYTRAPEAKFPQPHEECVDVLRWLHTHGRAGHRPGAALHRRRLGRRQPVDGRLPGAARPRRERCRRASC